MNSTLWIVIIIAAIVVVAIIAWLVMQRRRTEDLKEQFGPEYDRAVQQYGDERKAEATLQQREKRVEALDIRPLSPEVRDRFAQEWRSVQARFVDDPSGAVKDADRLVNEVMQAKGYPVADFEQRAGDVSVNHPVVVSNYRSAHAIAQANDRGQASTEDLRKAMVNYRSLFEDLLAGSPSQQQTQQPRNREVA